MKWITVSLLGLMLCLIGYSPPAWAQNVTKGCNLQTANASTGNGTECDVHAYTTISVQVTISATATVVLEASGDGTSAGYTAKLCTLTVDGSTASSVTSSGLYQCNVAGLALFRARISANTGTVTVVGLASTAVFSGGSNGVAGWPVTSTTKEITWANSLANAARIGDGVTPGCLYTDAALGFLITPCTASNIKTYVPNTFTYQVWDGGGALSAEDIKPSAATPDLMWSYANAAYRPKGTVAWNADAMHTDGAQCGQPTERILNSGAPMSTIICTNNASSSIYGQVEMPDRWDGGTITFMWDVVQTAADTNIMNSHIAAACRAQGDTINNTWGTLQTLNIAAVGGSNKKDRVTSAAVTPNGTCTANGTLLQWRWQLDTSTTTAVATLHNIGMKMEYSTKSRSD